jgi:dTDP-4-amino-4,6-dideoxygalactose transaminase
LKAQYTSIREEVRRAIDEVCESQRFILGPQVEEFEKQVAAYSQCSHAIGVSSGTDALLVALMALEVKSGDEVVTTPYSFFATAGVIARLGAKPVFVDIDPRTYNLNPHLVEKAITARTRVIMPVHLFGQCADMDPLLELAQRHKLIVIEDAAQAIGAAYKSKRAGSIGELGCFSFYPSKNLGGFGDGGMVVTNDPELAERIRVLRVHGNKPKYYHNVVGGNFRLDELQAAILKVKLKYLARWTKRRQQNAAFFDNAFQGVAVRIPDAIWRSAGDSEYHIYNQYVIRAAERNQLGAALKEAGIGSEVYYPLPLHLQKCFGYLGYSKGAFPESERAAFETLALPIYPELTQDQLAYIADNVKRLVS